MQMPGNKNTSQMSHHEQKVMLGDQGMSKREKHQGESFTTPGEMNLYWHKAIVSAFKPVPPLLI